MENQLSIQRTGPFTDPVALQQIDHIASRYINSGALPDSINNGAQLSMVLQAGYEAGMTPMESINSYYIVNGKVTIWGDAVIRQLRRAGWKIKWEQSDEMMARVTLNKDGESSHTEEYTIEEARNAGLTNKGPWQKYPKEMLRHKVIGRAVRFTCPEVLNGLYLKEELDGSDSFDNVTLTKDQINRIKQLTRDIGVEELEVRNFVKNKYGCEIEQLTIDNAGKVIRVLEKRLGINAVSSNDSEPKPPENDPDEPKEGEVVDSVWSEAQEYKSTPDDNSKVEMEGSVVSVPTPAQEEAKEETPAAKAMKEGMEKAKQNNL